MTMTFIASFCESPQNAANFPITGPNKVFKKDWSHGSLICLFFPQFIATWIVLFKQYLCLV